MPREAWMADGRTIWKLRHAEEWLAGRLAGMGLRPDEDVEAGPVDAGEAARKED